MFCNAVWCYVCVVGGSSLGGCDRLVVVVVSGCVCLVAACTMKLNQYSTDFGYLGEKEGAIQCACGRECHLLVLMASAHTATIKIVKTH